MSSRAAVTILSLALLGGCTTPSAFRQTNGLIGAPLAAAESRYGPPDQPVNGGAGDYTWSGGRLTGACRLRVRTDSTGTIVKASVVGIGFDTCKTILKRGRG
jgi:hypothetical protein